MDTNKNNYSQNGTYSQNNVFNNPNFHYSSGIGESDYGKPHKPNGTLIAVIIIAFILLFMIVAVISYMLLSKNHNSAESDNKDEIEIEEEAATEEPRLTEEPVLPPEFTDYTVSSTRGTDYTSGAPVNYYPEYAFDGNMATAWSPNRAYSNNPYITLYANSSQHVSGIKMTNGYMKSQTTYYRNRRITEVEISYEGGSFYYSLNPDAFGVLQDIRFDKPADTNYITIKVVDSIYGDWKDFAISELEIY